MRMRVCDAWPGISIQHGPKFNLWSGVMLGSLRSVTLKSPLLLQQVDYVYLVARPEPTYHRIICVSSGRPSTISQQTGSISWSRSTWLHTSNHTICESRQQSLMVSFLITDTFRYLKTVILKLRLETTYRSGRPTIWAIVGCSKWLKSRSGLGWLKA